jgi:hypothetical protein
VTVRQVWRLWALLMVAAVLVWLGFEEPAPPTGTEPVTPRRAARLPALPAPPVPADPSAALNRLAQSTLWGPLPRAASAPGGSDAPAPKWSLSGYVDANGVRQVIVSFENLALPSRQLRVGDRLPDGTTIVAIEPDRVRVRAPLTAPPDGAASAPVSGWLPITPGLAPGLAPAPAPARR